MIGHMRHPSIPLAAVLLASTFAFGEGAPANRVPLAVGVLAVGASLLIAGWVVPGRRLVPYWGRAAELLHTLVAVSLLPLVLWLLGVYGTLRAIG